MFSTPNGKKMNLCIHRCHSYHTTPRFKFMLFLLPNQLSWWPLEASDMSWHESSLWLRICWFLSRWLYFLILFHRTQYSFGGTLLVHLFFLVFHLSTCAQTSVNDFNKRFGSDTVSVDTEMSFQDSKCHLEMATSCYIFACRSHWWVGFSKKFLDLTHS